MDIVKESNTWRDTHQQSIVITVLRVILGLLVLYKGIYFVSHWQELQSILSRSVFEFGSMALAHGIALCHLTGGLFIAAGFLTRVSCLFQIPWVLGAVLFANSPQSVFFVYPEWVLAIVILLGLCFFLFYGSGIYALDVLLKRNRFYE